MGTTTRELRVENWVAYFEAIAAGSGARSAAVEVIDGKVRDRPSVAPYPLRAIGYNPVEAVLEVTVGGRSEPGHALLRHFISDPRRINVEESGPLNPTAILVKDASGTRTRIDLFDRSPLMPGARVRGGARASHRPKQRLRDRSGCLARPRR